MANRGVFCIHKHPLMENGIGWQLRDGQINRRGSEAFDRSTHGVPERLEESGFQRITNEMREA